MTGKCTPTAGLCLVGGLQHGIHKILIMRHLNVKGASVACYPPSEMMFHKPPSHHRVIMKHAWLRGNSHIVLLFIAQGRTAVENQVMLLGPMTRSSLPSSEDVRPEGMGNWGGGNERAGTCMLINYWNALPSNEGVGREGGGGR